MIFNGIKNQTVEFKIRGYELPENSGPSYEANFLYIELNVESNFGNWQTDDCALSTTDFEKIINWFCYLQQNKTVTPQLNFMKKGVSFELIKNTDDRKSIRILFHSECTPQNKKDIKLYYVDLELNRVELKKVSEAIQKELNLFPTRGFEE